VLDLVDRGITDFHFYTMNRADLVYAVCHLLGLRSGEAREALSRAPEETPSLTSPACGGVKGGGVARGFG
jgi:hypothetical protein